MARSRNANVAFRTTFHAALITMRIHACGWTAMLGLVGAGLAGRWPSFWALVTVWSVEILVSSTGFIVNDLADVDSDRRNPERSSSPLVAGTITQAQARRLAVGSIATLTALAAAPVLSPAGRLLLCGQVLLGVYGNVRQKRSRLLPPPVMDLLFGVWMAMAVAVGAAVAPGPLPLDAATAACLALIPQMFLLNITAGNLKDIAADAASPGVRTTALLLGVRTEATGLVLTRSYTLLCVVAQAASNGGVIALVALAAGSSAVSIALCATAAGVAATVATCMLSSLLAGRPPHPRGREAFLFWNLLAWASAVSATAPAALVGASVAAAALWHVTLVRLLPFIPPKSSPARPAITPLNRRENLAMAGGESNALDIEDDDPSGG